MKKFNHTGLWAMLTHPETATGGATEPTAALDEFIAEIQEYCRQEKDLVERTRTLQFARSELATAQGRAIHTGAEKMRRCRLPFLNPSG